MNIKTRGITETSLAIAVFVVIYFLIMYIPIFGGFLLPVLGVSTIIITKRHGVGFGILKMIVSILLLIFLSDIFNALFIGLSVFPASILMGVFTRQKSRFLYTVFIGTLAHLTGILILFLIFAKMLDVSLQSIFTQYFDEVRTTLTDPEALSQLDLIEQGMLNLIPAGFIVYSMISASISYYLFILINRRVFGENIYLPPFAEIILPKHVSVAASLFILGFILVDQWQGTTAYLTNFMAVFQFLFAVPGLSVIYYHLSKKISKNLAFLLLIAFIMIGGMTFIPFIGMFDALLDTRKLRVPADN